MRIRAPARSNRERWIWAASSCCWRESLARCVHKAGRGRPAPLRFTVRRRRTDGSSPTSVSSPRLISPDGRTLAFVATVEGQTSIWIRPLDSDVPRALAGTEGVATPFWSPDSRSLAFLAESKLKRIAIAGGPPQTICDIVGAGLRVLGFKRRHRIRLWMGWPGSLYRVSADGGAVSEIRKPDPSKDEDGVALPEFLPDGDRFFYLAGVKNQRATACTSGRSVRRRAPSSPKRIHGWCMRRQAT